MKDFHANKQVDSTLRWGGLAGILGGVLMLGTFGFVAVFVGMDITPEQSLTTFPDIRAARTVENSLIALGMAMPGAPGYGRRSGRTTVALGAAGLAAATAVVVGVPAMAAVGVFALIGFHLTLGWKTHRLFRASHSRMLADA